MFVYVFVYSIFFFLNFWLQSSLWHQELQAFQDRAPQDAEAQKEKTILIASLQAELQVLRTQSEEESSKASRAIQDSEKWRLELEHFKKTSEEELAKTKVQSAALNSSRSEEFEQTLLEKETLLQEAKGEVKSLEAVIESKSLEQKTSLDEIKTLQSEVTQLRQEMENTIKHKDGGVKEMREKLSLLTEQCEELKTRLESDRNRYEEELKTISHDKETLKGELQKAKEDLVEAEKSSQMVVEKARGTQEKETVACKEENKKLKAFAVKLKKELAESRERVSPCWAMEMLYLIKIQIRFSFI